jgi:HTH-type transcriptional regulator/antitoxin HipB
MQAPIPDSEALGALLRRERKRQGLRQPDLAAAAGTSVRFIVEIERGKPTARLGKVLDVLAQLGLRLVVEGLSKDDGR